MNRGGVRDAMHVSADLAPRRLVVIHFRPNVCVQQNRVVSYIFLLILLR